MLLIIKKIRGVLIFVDKKQPRNPRKFIYHENFYMYGIKVWGIPYKKVIMLHTCVLIIRK